MRQLLTSLVKHDKIVTTEAQAKALKREVERLISRSKKLDLTARRKALSIFTEEPVANKFLDQVVAQFKDRVGGYVRVVKLNPRRGDQAPMARVEFVEEIKPAQAKEEVKKEKAPAPKAKAAPAPKKSAPKKKPAAKPKKALLKKK